MGTIRLVVYNANVVLPRTDLLLVWAVQEGHRLHLESVHMQVFTFTNSLSVLLPASCLPTCHLLLRRAATPQPEFPLSTCLGNCDGTLQRGARDGRVPAPAVSAAAVVPPSAAALCSDGRPRLLLWWRRDTTAVVPLLWPVHRRPR